MEKTRKITSILTLAVAFCLVLVSLVQAGPGATNIPIWQITQDGTDTSVKWVNHAPNPRFAIYDSGTPGYNLDDLVLDKETGLIWAKDANLADGTRTWEEAVTYCRNRNIGNRKGWRLPTVEELASLVDPTQSYPVLPSGHPFENVQCYNYWSSTPYEADTASAWIVYMFNGHVYYGAKSGSYFVWPVRGGSGPILVPHTP
jgi:hypothetical protein